MNEELFQRLEMFESLFAHPGWRLFVADVVAWRDAVASQWAALPDAKALHTEQGRHSAFAQVANFENLIDSVRAEAVSAANAEMDI